MIKELVPGQAPTQPLDINWLYLIKDKETRKLFMDGNKEVLPQTEDINQEDTHILNLGLPEAMQDHPEAHDQSDQILQQDQMQVLDEKQEQAEDDLDYSSTPTQDLFKIAERSLQAIQERLVAKQSALGDRLTAALNSAES